MVWLLVDQLPRSGGGKARLRLHAGQRGAETRWRRGSRLKQQSSFLAFIHQLWDNGKRHRAGAAGNRKQKQQEAPVRMSPGEGDTVCGS